MRDESFDVTEGLKFPLLLVALGDISEKKSRRSDD